MAKTRTEAKQISSYQPISSEELLKRGVCCGMGCRNCPYDPKHIRGNTNTNEKKPNKPN